MQKRKDRIIIISVYLLYIILIYILSRNLQTTQHIYYDLQTQNPFLRYQSSSQLSFCNRPILCKKVESFFMDWVLCHNKYKQSNRCKSGGCQRYIEYDADRYKQQKSRNKNKRNGGSFNLLQNNKPTF